MKKMNLGPSDHSMHFLRTIRTMARRRKVAVYLVGGFVRDALLNRPCLDMDFAVERGAVAFARALARSIRGAFVLLDAEHGCARVVRKEQGQILTFDFADFRAPTLRGDLRHRDFTINTLAVAVHTLEDGTSWLDQVLDYQKGKADLKGRTLRMTSVKTFREDPLRLLRAFSQQAVLGFKIESKTMAQIKKDVDFIRQSAVERAREEIFKILASPRACAVLKAMDKVCLLERVVPQLTVMRGVHQGGYHHLDVWAHSLETVRQFEGLEADLRRDPELDAYLKAAPAGGSHPRYALIKLALLLHDVGKPQTMKKEAARISFHGHERVGRDITRDAARLLKLSTKERYFVENLVLWHLRPGYLSNFERPSERAFFRYFRDTGEEAVSVAVLAMADQRATCGPLTTAADHEHHDAVCREILRRYFDRQKKEPLQRLLSGDDLIRVLRLQPSPVFGMLLKEVEEAQGLGRIQTREEALALARRMLDTFPPDGPSRKGAVSGHKVQRILPGPRERSR